MNKFFNLKLNDFTKGAVTALFTGIALSLGTAFSQTGFDVFAADWKAILSLAFNAGVATFVGYLMKNLTTSSDNDKILGKL